MGQIEVLHINTSQEKIFHQVLVAFEPLARFIPEATKEFIECLHGRLNELDLYTQKKIGELAEKWIQLKRGIDRLERHRLNGIVSDDEYEQILKAKRESLEQVKIEMNTHNEADLQTFNQ